LATARVIVVLGYLVDCIVIFYYRLPSWIGR
jgi:hypothetical protein